MENLVASQLSSLGGDAQLRKANLQNLISALTRQEIRELAPQLSRISFQTDIVGLLPVELLLLVAECIEGSDIFNFLNVSKRWRAVWLQENVIRLLAEKWFPGFLKYYALQKQRTGVAPDLPALFDEATRRFHCRSLGKFRSALFVDEWLTDDAGCLEKYFRLDPDFHPPGQDWKLEFPGLFTEEHMLQSYRTRVFYSHGRLAWQPDGLRFPESSVIFVDDFRTQSRRIYRVPGVLMQGQTAILRALGDRLVVATAGRVMVAWHLELNDFQQVTLPMPPSSSTTSGDMVATSMGTDGDLGIWKFGHQLRAVTMPKSIKAMISSSRQWISGPYLFSDPLQCQTFYGVMHDSSINSDRSLEIHKFSGGQYSETFSFNLNEVPGIDLEFSSELFLECGKAGTYGDSEIATMDLEVSNFRLDGDSLTRDDEMDPSWEDPLGKKTLHIIFNVLESSFSAQRRLRLPGGSHGPSSTYPHLEGSRWNGRHAHAYPVTGGFLSTRHSEDELLAENLATIPIYTVTPQSDEGPRGHRYLRRKIMDCADHLVQNMPQDPEDDGLRMGHAYCEPRFILDLAAETTPESHANREMIATFEDDDFIVIAHSHGYMVWSFWTDMVCSRRGLGTGVDEEVDVEMDEEQETRSSAMSSSRPMARRDLDLK